MTAQSGNVLNNNAVDPAGSYIPYHPLKVRAFKIHPRAATIRVCVSKNNIRLICEVMPADFLLVSDGILLRVISVFYRKAAIKAGFPHHIFCIR